MITCIQCALRALLNDETPQMFAETANEHIQRCHPDQDATRRERVELEQRLMDKLGKKP